MWVVGKKIKTLTDNFRVMRIKILQTRARGFLSFHLAKEPSLRVSHFYAPDLLSTREPGAAGIFKLLCFAI